MKKQKIGHRAQVQAYERQVLDILGQIAAKQNADSGYDCLTDKPMVADLVKAKDSYVRTANSPINDSQEMEQLKTLVEPFMPHIKLCQTFWKVISRYLPVVNKSSKFVFSQYRKTIASVFVNDGLHPGSLSEEQHTALQQSVIAASFQFVFPSLPTRDSLFAMFMSAYIDKEQAGKLNKDGFNQIVSHIRAEMGNKVDFGSRILENGNVLENLKNSNVVNLFYYIARFIAEQFGPKFPSFIPVFQVDSVIASTATVATIVVAEDIVNPTALIQQFVSARCKHDNMESISLSDDVRVIRAARKTLTTAMTRGSWVMLHYCRPSRSAAAMLTDVFTQMTSTPINPNFRLIIIASSIEYMSVSMVCQSNRLNIESFPCIRNQMLRVFHQHSSAIRSTSNSKAIKKLSYICAMLLSIIEFRNFLQPASYSGYIRASSAAFSQIIELLSAIIDAHPNDIPLGNLCHQIEKLIYSNVADDYDRKRISAVMRRLLVPEILEDGYSLTPNSKERDIWTIPGDIPLASFTQIIERLPFVPSPEVLHVSGSGIQNWNMSLWTSHPFAQFEEAVAAIDPQQAILKVENLKLMLPDMIKTDDTTKFTGAMGLYLLSEIEAINSILAYLREDVERIADEIQRSDLSEKARQFAAGEVPTEWKNQTRIRTFSTLHAFSSHIVERHGQLTRCVQEQRPSTFDARLLENPRRLLQAFLTEAAIEMKLPNDALCYQFQMASAAGGDSRTLCLTNLVMMAGNITVSGLEPAPCSSITPVSALRAKVVQASAGPGKTFPVPLYHQAHLVSDEITTPVHNGQSDNFVCSVTLPTSDSEDVLLEAGTTMFCRIPEQLIL